MLGVCGTSMAMAFERFTGKQRFSGSGDVLSDDELADTLAAVMLP